MVDGRSGRSDSDDTAINPELPAKTVLELDHVYDVLAHSRRRYICYALLEDAEWSLDTLARQIAAWEDDVPESSVSEHRRKSVYVSLHHSHIPKLTAHGIVAYDEYSEVITAAANAVAVLRALGGIGASLDSTQERHARN